MRRSGLFFTPLVLAAMWVFLATPPPTTAAPPPSTVHYQGRLTDSNGRPLEGVVAKLTFRLYNAAAPAPGAFVWGEVHETVAISRGVFTVILGAGSQTVDATGAETGGANPLVPGIFSTNAPRFIEVQVDSDAPLAPLTPISSVPFAISASITSTILDPLTSNGLDLDALDARYVRMTGGSFNEGDLFYADASGTVVQLPVGLKGQVLTVEEPVVGGPRMPAWADPAPMRTASKFFPNGTYSELRVDVSFEPKVVFLIGAGGAFLAQGLVSVATSGAAGDAVSLEWNMLFSGGTSFNTTPLNGSVTQFDGTAVRINFNNQPFQGTVLVIGD